MAAQPEGSGSRMGLWVALAAAVALLAVGSLVLMSRRATAAAAAAAQASAAQAAKSQPSLSEMPLVTDPPGAEAFLEEQSVGRTPINPLHLATQPQKLTLRLTGYDDWVAMVSQDQPPPPSIQLAKASDAKVRVIRIASSPAGADIFINGKLSGLTPAEALNVPGGTVDIHLRLKGYKDWKGELQPSDTLPDTIKLVKADSAPEAPKKATEDVFHKLLKEEEKN